MDVRRTTSFSYSLRALGRNELPPSISIGAKSYRHEKTVKHDFWAATGFYVDESGHRVVLKLSRSAPFFAMPYKFIGQWLCRREVRFYRALQDLPNVPRLLGTLEDRGFVHAYVAGVPLTECHRVPQQFFTALQNLIAEIHRRGIAYADTNKCSNILFCDDGQPHLIDFQISWDLHELGNTALNRWWLRRLQHEDRRHVLKHKSRLCPAELSPEERQFLDHRSAILRLHRFFSRPVRHMRRRFFKGMRQAGQLLPEGSA
ncbi:MAG TPA: hypothetical protein VMD30_01840 [Tepidisphaeraceae bacterium]|nr:hypothetical protein [Tepidisphaeraceae bacterium]